jgi:DoxX-like family
VSIMGASRTLTSRERALYRASTGLVLAVMLFSIVNFVFNDHFPFPNGPEGAFVHLGFPPYFKVELTLAKILGVLALVIPAVPFKVKEFAYAGFAITLVSAAIAHFGRGDARNLSVLYVVDPLVFFCLLAVSYYYFEKSHSLQAAATADEGARGYSGAHEKTSVSFEPGESPRRPLITVTRRLS